LWHAAWLAPVDIEGLSSLFGEDFSAENIYAPVLEHWSESSASYRRDRALEYYVDFYLQGDILTKLDRSSMQFSLEVRTPFLDRDLAEFCASLPYTAKHAFGVRKRLLRRVASELLPPAVLQRRKKGFGIPISNWLRALSRPELETAALLGLDPRFLDRAWSEHKQRRRDHRGLLWAWICLDRWHQTLGEVMFERRKTA
jgi:asparagine synthase (glutamine-hydrolysing)